MAEFARGRVCWGARCPGIGCIGITDYRLAKSLDRIFSSVFRYTFPHLWSVSVVGTEGKLR